MIPSFNRFNKKRPDLGRFLFLQNRNGVKDRSLFLDEHLHIPRNLIEGIADGEVVPIRMFV